MSDEPEVPPEESLSHARREEIRQAAVEVLQTVYDPEIPVNIYELGLVYEVDVKPDGYVLVRMTLTSPACPVAGSLPGEVEQRVQGVEGAKGCEVDLTWDPPWTPDRMSEAARLQLGIM
jgi:FeS assembly SUF system protein